MQPTPRARRASVRRGTRTLAVGSTTLLLTLGLAGPALADPAPSPTPSAPTTSPAAPTGGAPAPGTPSDDQLEQAREALLRQQAQVDAARAAYAAADARLTEARRVAELASEQYNGAKVRLDASTKAFHDAEAKAKAAEAALAKARTDLGRVAAQTYETRSALTGLQALAAGGPGAALQQSEGLQTLGQVHVDAVRDATKELAVATELRQAAQRANDQRKRDEATAAAARDKAAAAEQAAVALAEQTKAAQDAALAQMAALNKTSVELERARAEGLLRDAQQRAAQQREIDALLAAGKKDAAAKVTARGTLSAGDLADPGEALAVPAPNPRAQKAIDFAMAQLGDWYLWGGAGPDRWDCSGLTQAAWGSAGAGLDHFTGSQWRQTDRVALSDLQPGDLVFFGKDVASIHHVGMYLGGGKMINAPHTGAQVRIESMYWSDLLPYGGRVRA